MAPISRHIPIRNQNFLLSEVLFLLFVTLTNERQQHLALLLQHYHLISSLPFCTLSLPRACGYISSDTALSPHPRHQQLPPWVSTTSRRCIQHHRSSRVCTGDMGICSEQYSQWKWDFCVSADGSGDVWAADEFCGW
jgi:hypothetical protein